MKGGAPYLITMVRGLGVIIIYHYISIFILLSKVILQCNLLISGECLAVTTLHRLHKFIRLKPIILMIPKENEHLVRYEG